MTVWTLDNYNREILIGQVFGAPVGARVIIDDGPPRTGPQNRLMWRLLNCFADQYVHCGRKYDAEGWKCILLNAFGKELQFAPSLDGQSVVAFGYRSSLLTKEEMADFIAFISSEGAARGVAFDGEWLEHEPAA